MEPSETPQNDPPVPPKVEPILNYRDGKEDAVSPVAEIALLLAGMLVGGIFMTFAGCGVFGMAGYAIDGSNKSLSRWPVPLFFVLAVTAIFGTAAAFRAERRRWFVIGLLLSIAGMCLIEGLCFTNS